MRQIEAAPGAIGYSLGADLLTLRLYTLCAWKSDSHLRDFVNAAPHSRASAAFRQGMREPSVFVRWEVQGTDLPLAWAEAVQRQNADIA